jgi:acyl-homoserine-lactone acylase
MKFFYPFALISFCTIVACNKPTSEALLSSPVVETTTDELDHPAEILWDEWGVPHIYASNNKALFYSFGWAQMKSHGNTILKLYGNSRGRAAEYWGADHLLNDRMVHAMNFPALASDWYDQQSPEFKGYIDAFVEGMNAYVTAHPESVQDTYQQVLPVESHDILKHAMFVIYSRFVGGDDLRAVPNWVQSHTGSNTYAVGPSRSASGNAMLVMNPHLPWYDEWLFYEGHFNTPDLNLYGATLVGLPTLGIAFNEHLGWSHTNNTIDNSDRYILKLNDQGQYQVGDEWRDLSRRRASIKVKGDDDSIVIRDEFFYESPDHGPILGQSGDEAIAVRLPGLDRPYGIVQWWNMGKSTTLGEFQSTLKEVQIPFFNIMYADQAGNIFYMFNGQVPVRQQGDWSHWTGEVDGTDPLNIWQGIHSYDDLPKVENPASGWLQNANDPPWTSTFPMELDPEDFPPYMAPVRMTFRPQRSARMLAEDESITFEELEAYKLSTRIEMADRLLDDLFAAVDAHGGDAAKEAKEVLMNWDREANADSRGMALFYNWAHAISPYKQSNYAEQWSLDKARTTPDGLANPEAAVQALEGVVGLFKSNGVPLDIPWGQVYRIKYNDQNLPGNGADGSVGIFRVAWSENGPQEDGRIYINGGDTWQSIIEFGDQVKARVLMSYGNSTQEGSPHYGDQLELFSKKQMRDCYFYKVDVLQHVATREVMDK